MGTPAFMPIQILGSTDEMPVRHQELHEDKAVFWIGLLAIISRSILGCNYIRDNLESPHFSLTDLAHTKYDMFSPVTQKLRWPSMSSSAQSQSNATLHKLCGHIVKIQFTNNAGEPHDYTYPDVTEVDELTLCRKHET
ncbi:MAG: hypothetical protein M1839_006826 [Geoglossum umbratile]|nr:MAG: hypothetical protein M1839_006826 [Geoglossum umbratile]